MTATRQQHRLTQLAILAITGATAVSLAACGNSSNENTGKPSTSASSTISSPSSPSSPEPPPAPPMGHDEVEGLVRSVSGNRIQLTQRDRTAAAVDFTPSTMVTELGPAKLPDVTPGSCVDVEAAAQSGPPGGPVTAQSVTISPSEGGKCPPPAPSPAGPAESPSVTGIVDSVAGNTIAVNSIDPTGKTTHTTVNVADTTTEGGVICGKRAIGSSRKAIRPASVIRIASTVAKIGRSMKKLLMKHAVLRWARRAVVPAPACRT